MSDLIKKADAIKTLKKTEPAVWTESDYELGQKNQWSLDILAIECLPSAEPKWNPVSERLPKENGKYLVSVEKSEWDGTTRRSVRTMSYNKREVDPFKWGHYEIYSGKVTAWMELPTPWKGGE